MADEYRWLDVTGPIAVVTEKAIGIATKDPQGGRADIPSDNWIPTGHLNRIRYEDGLETTEVFKGKVVKAVEIAEWLYNKKNKSAGESALGAAAEEAF